MRKQADEVKAIADDAQRDLDIAMPALESAPAKTFEKKTVTRPEQKS